MVKSSITKAPFKKWLKAISKGSALYYESGRFIGTELNIVNLSIIDNLDDLKPAIVEIFGHLEGCWKRDVDGEVYDLSEEELHNEIEIGDVYSPIQPDELPQIIDSEFRTKCGAYIYDDLTVIPASLEFFDYHNTFKDDGVVYFTVIAYGEKEVLMLLDGVTNLTGNDIDIDFVKVLEKAYNLTNQDAADMSDKDGDEDAEQD